MAIHAELLLPAKDCSRHLDELIKKMRDVKVSGSLNIFAYSPSQSELDKESAAEIKILLALAKKDFDLFQENLRNDNDWQECFANPGFYQRTIEIIGERLHAVNLSGNVMPLITQLENISNNMNGVLETFMEFSCVEGYVK